MTASPARSRSPRPPAPPGPTTSGSSPPTSTSPAPRSSCRGSRASRRRLREGLGPVRERFAYTLLDCPPSLGPVTVNALVAADKVIVPVQAEYLALEGLVQFLDTLKLIQRELNPSLEMAGVVITMHDERTRLSQDVERELREHLPAPGLQDRDPAQHPRRRGAQLRRSRSASTTPNSAGLARLPGARRGGHCRVAERKRGMGRGLAAILPESGRRRARAARAAGRADRAQPRPAAHQASRPARSTPSPARSRRPGCCSR